MRTIGIAGAILTVAICARADAPAPPASPWRILHVADTNGDGMDDAIWVDETTDRAAVSLLNGTRLLAAGPPIPGPPGGGWRAVIAADFNGDGMNDIIWSHDATSRLSVTLLDGAHVLAQGPALPGPPGEGWVVAAAGDMNGDGLSDAVWFSPARQAAVVWLMNGTRVLAAGPEIPAPPGGGWTISDVADMNGDGLGDIVWNTPPLDYMHVWLMQGTRVLARGPELRGPPGTDWKVLAIGDFNGDGLNDVMWTRPGRMLIWLMKGTEVREAGQETAGPGDDWEVASVDDTNGDGMADAVWQKIGASLMSVWLLRGTNVLAKGPEIAGPQ
jgi:hypothetical protein